ncbi:hypothetical protein CRU92_03175 [Arcobacter sp. FW59]|nr:hypothetical protein CRU92_03175 [Arcobacter sp. FW59]
MKSNTYLSPYNDISIRLSEENFFKKKFNLLGFIDNNKKGANISNSIDKNFDNIIICSPNYHKEIYYKLIDNNVEKEKILFYAQKTNKLITNLELVSFYDYDVLDSYNKIKELKNKYKYKRAFIIGNGPSLKTKDLELMKGEITFAANKIYLAYKDTDWRPTFYAVEDDLVYKQNYKEIKNLKDSIKLFPQYALNWNKKIDDAIYFNLKYTPDDISFPQFNPDPILGVYWGSTIIFSMIQWAIYLGIDEIYLLGVDFNFVESKKFILNEYNRKDLICEGEVNHFHKDYRKIGEKWNLPNLDVQLKSFSKAKEYCDSHGIKIYNVSRSTKLTIFELKNLDLLFKER